MIAIPTPTDLGVFFGTTFLTHLVLQVFQIHICVTFTFGALFFFLLLIPRSSISVLAKAPTNKKEDYGVYSKGPYSTYDATQKTSIRYSPKGPMSQKENPAQTVPECFAEAVKRHGDKIALAIERDPITGTSPAQLGPKKAPSLPWDQWTKWTYAEYHSEVKNAAKGMIAHGLERYGSVAVFGFNAPEWHMGFMASIFAGAKCAGIYPTDTTDTVGYKVKHAAAAIAVVEGQKEITKIATSLKDLKKLKLIVVYGEPCESYTLEKSSVKVMHWKDLIHIGAQEPNTKIEERLSQMQPGNAAALVYTSGTTGAPKACMLSHDNLLCLAKLVMNHLFGNLRDRFTDGEQAVLSYLPLSHVAGINIDIVGPMMATALFERYPCCCYFARKYDMSAGTLLDRLKFVRPCLFVGVPRVWEKFAEALKVLLLSKPPISWILGWAMRKNFEHIASCQLGGDGHFPLQYGIANFISKRIKKKLGFDRLGYAVTGAAPIQMETLEFWAGLGIGLCNLFGMSESNAGGVMSFPNCNRWGCLGPELPGVETKILNNDDPKKPSQSVPACRNALKISEKEQGEICIRSRTVMMGYYANPEFGSAHVQEVQGKNAATIDKNGWLLTGDKGTCDQQGMIRITGRYKELIITAGGENLAPVPIEDWVKSNYQAISNIVMIGDERKYNTCVLTLKCNGATGQDPGTDELTNQAASICNSKTIGQAKKDAKMKAYLEGALKAVNANTEVVPNNAAKIQKYVILDQDFSVEGDELTPTLKIKRGFIANKYAKEIESMY